MTHQVGKPSVPETADLTQSPLLAIENLGRRVGDRWIWEGVNFQVWPGDRLAIAGRSGAGKSLLLRAIACLDPIQSGQILYQNRSVSSWFMPHYRSQIVYLHQRPALLEGTVESNLHAVYQLTTHRHKAYNRQQILDYLEVLGRTADFLERPIAALSGGEAQIVAFLRVLQVSPQILLFDEPTASLDPQTVDRVEALVKTWIAEDPQRAYLWTSHAPEQLERMTEGKVNL